MKLSSLSKWFGVNQLMVFSKIVRKSLGLRVSILSTIWVITALLTISVVSMMFYRQSNEQYLERILNAHLYSLISAVNVSTDGKLQGNPELGDIRYSDPSSGWYWEVVSLSNNLRGRLTSASLGTKQIMSPNEITEPFDNKFFRSYRIGGVDGQHLLVVENDIILDNQNRVARFRVMGNIDETYAQLKKFKDTLISYLTLFGIASVLINIGIIYVSLRPLKRIRQSLADIRAGKDDHVDTNLPIEVVPLAYEMNALIDNNQRIVERFRVQVGNLAHSLKTPLSVIANEAEGGKTPKASLIREQANTMQSQINHYLQRARIAAQRDSVIYQTPIRKILERIVRVMAKLNPDKTIEFHIDAPDIYFAGEKEDIEEIVGNLLENACKWAKHRIVIFCKQKNSDNILNMFSIIVEDDGLGLAAEKRNDAIKRGKRLDESKPGTGLGLSIVSDLVNEYGGNILLSDSAMGGLCVTITLPLANT